MPIRDPRLRRQDDRVRQTLASNTPRTPPRSHQTNRRSDQPMRPPSCPAHPGAHQNLIHTCQRPKYLRRTQRRTASLTMTTPRPASRWRTSSLPRGRIPFVQRYGGGRDRTDDPLLAKQVLSQLSYAPTCGGKGRRRNGGPGRI